MRAIEGDSKELFLLFFCFFYLNDGTGNPWAGQSNVDDPPAARTNEFTRSSLENFGPFAPNGSAATTFALERERKMNIPEHWHRVTLRLALNRESRRGSRLLPSFRVTGHGRSLALHRLFQREEIIKRSEYVAEKRRDAISYYPVVYLNVGTG